MTTYLNNKNVVCPYCPRRFADENGLWMHSKAKHRGKKNPRPARDDEPSMAELFIEAQIARDCGEPVDEWLLNMLP